MNMGIIKQATVTTSASPAHNSSHGAIKYFLVILLIGTEIFSYFEEQKFSLYCGCNPSSTVRRLTDHA